MAETKKQQKQTRTKIYFFEKEINFSSFFEKDSPIKTQKGFVEKMCIHLTSECCENFPEHPKWTRMNA